MSELLTLYGPLAIHSYGLCIILGLITSSFLLLRDARCIKLISFDQYTQMLSHAILIGIIGGRLLYIVTNWYVFESYWDFFAIWHGGFSLLGTVMALLIAIPLYLRKNRINMLEFCDVASIYAPLLQAIARIGCFCAGCCGGIALQKPGSFLGIWFTNHPSQLYSSISLFIIFLLMYFIFRHQVKQTGQLLCTYIMLMTVERFIVDLWRTDRQLLGAQLPVCNWLSTAQLLALLLFLIACIFNWVSTGWLNKAQHESI